MKKYIYLFVLLFLGNSCTKTFLDENTNGSVLDPKILFTSDQIQLASDDLPRLFRNIYGQSGCVGPFMGGDDLTAHPSSNKLRFREVDIFAASDDNDRILLYWQNCFAVIRSANSIFANVEKSIASQSVIDDVKGQAYFYRGLSYSFLTRIFGKVPLITKFDLKPDLTIQSAEVAAIYDQIVTDLQTAEGLLPDVRSEGSGDRGGYPGAKPCKGTVKALLSQVYLTMAGWPLKQTANYALAAAKAREVIDNASTYKYAILTNPKDLWTWANNYTNQEIVLGMYFNTTTEQSMHGPLGSRPEEWVNPNASWASGWCDYFAEISFFKRFPAGIRKDATYQTIINVAGVDVSWDDARTNRQHPYFAKFQDEFPGSSWVGARAGQVIRYAEVLLNYAEAQAMAEGTPNADAYNAINTIRNRAGLPNLVAGLSGTAFRDSVIKERGWEFAGGEAPSRWFDLIRTETLEQVTLLRDPKELTLKKQPTHDDYWMPIPVVDGGINPNLLKKP